MGEIWRTFGLSTQEDYRENINCRTQLEEWGRSCDVLSRKYQCGRMSNVAGYVDSPVKIFGMFFDGYMFEVVLGKKKRPSI